MTSIVNASMVSRFEVVEGECSGSYPCEHTVKIALEDGRKVNAALTSYKIHCLIKEIASKKIVNQYDDNHFNDMSLRMLKFHTNGNETEFPNAEMILTEIFNTK